MTDEQWTRAWEIYAAASGLAGEERRSYLRSVSADPEILGEVISMVEEAERTNLGPTLPEPASRSGTRFGRYELGELLGSGGMGAVYAAHDPELGRKVALKFLSVQAGTSGAAIERLIREAKAASALNHPHIITVYEVIRQQDDVAIAMELVEGRALRQFCGKRADIGELIHWGRQIAQALAAAHERNVIHRDVKPENLMVRNDGILKVLDFGLAGQSQGEEPPGPRDSSRLGGTLDYMSPEQTRGEPATSASDIFSLGLVLYELTTGRHPFRSDSPIDTADSIASDEPKAPSSLNPKIPAHLERLILRMLSKDPRERPTARSVDQQLQSGDLPKPGRPSSSLAWMAAVIVLATICSALAYVFRDRLFAATQPRFTQLTRQLNENRVTSAAISPDGGTVLFATLGGPVYRRRMSDGLSWPVDALKALRVDRMVWFQDGSRVLINGSSARGQYEPGIWTMSAEGGGLEKIASEAKNGVPSPDGSRIALTNMDGSVLSVMSSRGEGRRQIRSGGDTTAYSSLVWSPDGKRIAYQRAEYLPPANSGSDPKFFLTLNHYAYSYESVDVDTGITAVSASNFLMESACGLRDGRLLFLRNTIANPLIYYLWSVRTDPRTGRFLEAPRQFTHDDYDLKEISASADGGEAIVIRAANRHPNVYVADLPPARQHPRFTRVRRLTFTDADEYPHSWTPDGRSVIFESNRNGNFDLFRQDIDQSAAQPLAVSNDAKVLAHVSPDGKWILYNQQLENRQWKVMRIPMEGGSAATVVPDGSLAGEYTCSALPTGRCALRTVQNDKFVFWHLDPLRGKGRELARTRWSPAIIGDWDISPNGSLVAIPYHDPRDARVRLVPLDSQGGATERNITIKGLKNLSGVTWAADGKGWYVTASGMSGAVLFYVDLEGTILTNLMESMVSIFAVPSPDGRHVAYLDWAASANIWQVRGL